MSRGLTKSTGGKVLLVCLVFGIAAALTLVGVFAMNENANQNSNAVVPFREEPARGLTWASIKADPQSPLCGGELLVVIDKEGKAAGCTHGPDPAPEGVDITEELTNEALANNETILQTYLAANVEELGLNSQQIQCVGDGTSGQRVEIIYAVASDKPDRFDVIKNYIPAYAANIEHTLTQSAIIHGANDADVKFVTSSGSDCLFTINKVILSDTGDDTFGNTLTELRAAGYTRSDRKYLALVDATIYCGVGTIFSDDKPTQDNNNNGRFASHSRVDSGCWGRSASVEAHEMMHNIGSVQKTSPNATTGFHCTDDYDRMCYRDSVEAVMKYNCDSSREPYLDCGGDDYFNPNPAPNSWLATHWNTANSLFLQVDRSSTTNPDTTPPTVSITAPTSASTVSGVVAIAANAADNIAVNKVDFLVGSTVVNTDTSSPYTYNWDTKLVANGTYNLTARATDSSGLVTTSTPVSVTVTNLAPVDSQPPTVAITSPLDEATVAGQFNVSVSATDNVSVTSVKLKVNGSLYGGDLVSPYQFALNLSDGNYTLVAEASDGTQTALSAPITVQVSNGPAPDTSAPTAPANLTATAVSFAQIDLSWGASTDNVGVASYQIRRNNIVITSISGATTYQDKNVLPNTSYSYTVYALDSAQNMSPASNTSSATTPDQPDTTAPTAPTSLAAGAASSSQINLSWTRSTDNVGVKEYRIFRGGTLRAVTSNNTFGDSGLTPGTTYTYTVKAVDAAGNLSPDSNQASATTTSLVSDTTPPTTPQSLAVSGTRGKNLDLLWTASTDNIGVTGYYVYRKEASALSFTRVATVSAASYTDNKASPKFTWQYYVRAFDAAGNLSGNSNTISNK